jgi:hypothetical protein
MAKVVSLRQAMKEGLRAEQALRVIVERRVAAIRDAKQGRAMMMSMPLM